MIINPYCRDWGWLFEDLKASLAAVDLSDKCVCTQGNRCVWHVEVVASEEPLPDADAWICIRTDEAGACPDLSRCVVQVHDYREHQLPLSPGCLQFINDHQWRACSALDPAQMDSIAVLPIGPRSAFQVRESMPERPTVGWVGRDVVYQGRHIKRPELFVEVVRELASAIPDLQATMYGEFRTFDDGHLVIDIGSGDRSVASLQRFYHSIDVLINTTEPEPGPLSIYEALACGVPVVSTPTGAAEEIGSCSGCFVTSDILEPWEAAAVILDGREGWFGHRQLIAQSVAHLSQEAWARRSVELAVEVASG